MKQVIKPCWSTYLALLNVFPFLFILYGVIALDSPNSKGWVILLVIGSYISCVLFVLRSNFIIIECDFIVFSKLFKKRSVRFVDIVSVEKKRDSRFSTSLVCLRYLLEDNREDTITVRSKWYNTDHIDYLCEVVGTARERRKQSNGVIPQWR